MSAACSACRASVLWVELEPNAEREVKLAQEEHDQHGGEVKAFGAAVNRAGRAVKYLQGGRFV